jgi:hypothetical protein
MLGLFRVCPSKLSRSPNGKKLPMPSLRCSLRPQRPNCHASPKSPSFRVTNNPKHDTIRSMNEGGPIKVSESKRPRSVLPFSFSHLSGPTPPSAPALFFDKSVGSIGSIGSIRFRPQPSLNSNNASPTLVVIGAFSAETPLPSPSDLSDQFANPFTTTNFAPPSRILTTPAANPSQRVHLVPKVQKSNPLHTVQNLHHSNPVISTDRRRDTCVARNSADSRPTSTFPHKIPLT